jgi:hypothetical protein
MKHGCIRLDPQARRERQSHDCHQHSLEELPILRHSIRPRIRLQQYDGPFRLQQYLPRLSSQTQPLESNPLNIPCTLTMRCRRSYPALLSSWRLVCGLRVWVSKRDIASTHRFSGEYPCLDELEGRGPKKPQFEDRNKGSQHVHLSGKYASHVIPPNVRERKID